LLSVVNLCQCYRPEGHPLAVRRGRVSVALLDRRSSPRQVRCAPGGVIGAVLLSRGVRAL
jgi:hypothetical protein